MHTAMNMGMSVGIGACARHGLLGLPLAWLGLALGVLALFFPPLAWLGTADRALGSTAAAAPATPAMPVLAWLLGAMAWTFLSYSLAQVLYLAWGTRLGGDLPTRARIVAWREGWGLLGVVMANVLALQLGLAAALSVPLWTRLIARWGAWRAWAAGMALSVPPFLVVLALGPGDVLLYLGVCVVCGLALGADLTAPGTLLTGVVRQSGHANGGEGAYAGWWHWGAKLNLALAAGLALPALQWLGYQPGQTDADGLLVLAGVYGLLPCGFKLLALAVGWRHRQLLAAAT